MDIKEMMAACISDYSKSTGYQFMHDVGDGEADMSNFGAFIRAFMGSPEMRSIKKPNGDPRRLWWKGFKYLPGVSAGNVTEEDLYNISSVSKLDLDSRFKNSDKYFTFLAYMINYTFSISDKFKSGQDDIKFGVTHIHNGNIYLQMQLIDSLQNPMIEVYFCRKN